MSNPFDAMAKNLRGWRAMVQDIERAVREDNYHLNEKFENPFLENVKRYLAQGWELSDKMDQALEKLWRRATGHD
jgi:hypothetical protein